MSTKLNEEEVRHIANLARIGLTEEEVAFYAQELSGVLSYVEQLNDVATDGVEPMGHAGGAHSVARSDSAELWGGTSWKEVLLAMASSVQRGMVKVGAILDKSNE